MPNPFALDQIQPQDAAANSNPFAISTIQADQQTMLRSSLVGAVGGNPDEAAKANDLARQIGAPPEVVQRNMDEVRNRLLLDSYSNMIADKPATRTFLSNPQNAKVAFDDTPTLSSMETLLDALGSTAKYITSHPSSRTSLMRDIGAGFQTASRGGAGIMQAVAELPEPLVGTVLPENPFRPMAQYFADVGKRAGANAKTLSPAGDSMVGNAVSSGIQSLVGNAMTMPMALLPGGQMPALLAMAGQQGGTSYQTAREQGMSNTQALAFAVPQAVIEYATEKLPMHVLLKDLNAGTGLGKTLLHNMASEIPGEQIATVMQDLNEWAALPENANKPFSSYLADRPSAAAQTLIATMIGVGGQVSVMKAIQTAADNAMGLDRQAQAAEQAAQQVEQLTALTEASKLRERDPATFQAFVQQASGANGETPTEMYISAETLANTLNQSGISMAEIQAIAPSVAQQMTAENYVPGADLRIPVAELLAAPSEISATLIDHLRASPDAMSRAEAGEFIASQGDQIKQEVEKELAKRDDRAAVQKGIDEVSARFEQQLNDAGKFRPEVNKAYASLLGNFYATQAARAGMTPGEFMQRYQLGISAKEQAGRQRLDQSGDKPRGALSFGSDITQGPSILQLLEGADLSTTIHESSHFFLEVQADLSARVLGKIHDNDTVTEGERQIAGDMDTILKWFGITGTPDRSALETWQSMSLDEKRDHHEQFARSFERYTMEGKAPSLEMQSLFQRFRSWLVSVYKVLASLNSNLTDDVRAVMDRMLASDEAIQQAQDARNMGPLFQTPEQAGMTPDEYAEYQAMGQQATDNADAELDARLMKDMKWLSRARDKALKARQKEVAGLRMEARNEVSREVWSQPVYQAWQFLTGKGEKVLPGTMAPENIDTVRESGKLRTSFVKQIDEFSAETLIRRKMTSETTGMDPDIAADLFGFTSGEQLVQALAAADEPNAAIDALTDQRMLELHGDIASKAELDRAADEAVHNQLRARVIAAELKAITKATTVRDEGANSLYGRSTIDVMAKAAGDYAAQVVSRQKLKDLRPKQYASAEARSAKLAQQSLGKDLAESAMHKRNQLVNNLATKAAYAAQEEIAKANDFFKKVLKGTADTVGKTRDWGTVQAARAVLAEYGIGTKGEPAQSYLSAMERDDPATAQILRDRIDQITAGAKPVAEMTVEEFRGLVEEVQSLWHMAKRSKQVEIDGQLVDRAMVEGDLLARLTEIGIPDRVPGEGRAVTDAERRLTRLQTLGAALRRVESWVGVKDGTQTMGPFRKYVWQPVKEAADKYRADKATYIKRYKALLETVDLGQAKIEAPELGYTFGYSRGGSGKAEILHAILHTGNQSNKRKLLLGRGWATENEITGALDTTKWDAFVARLIDKGILTKADFDFAQGVWNLLEDMKALAQKAHRDVFGHYFAEVTADSFTNKFGTYAGGYVPAMMDPEVVKDAATRALVENEQQTLAYAFPATAKGFTKSRVEINRPLLLDLRTLSSHIDKVLLFSHMEQPIRDVRKVLGSKNVSDPLHRIDPTAFDGLITPWLNRAARQTVEQKVPGDGTLMRVFSKMRQRAGLAAMFANVSNTAQQITGLSIAAIKVRPKYLLEAAAQSIIAPRQTAKAVAGASTYMATRMDNEVAAMTDAIDQILLNPSVYEKARSWTAQHAYFMQSAVDNFLGPIVWNGAYNQALEQGHNERDSIRLADSAVRETQGSTMPEDVSRIETGNAFVRMFTQFAGYFNMQANTLGTEFARNYHELGMRKGMGRGLYIFVLGFLVPNMVAELIAQAFKGGPDDEDKDGSTIDDWIVAVMLMGNVKAGLAMIPGVGQATNALINTFNKKPYDDRISTSPAVSMIESAVSAPHSVYKAVAEDGDARKAIRDLATLISMSTGLPANAIARPLGYAAGMSDNKIAPTSGPDMARGLITGTPSPESKR